jgi:hypothetical protein
MKLAVLLFLSAAIAYDEAAVAARVTEIATPSSARLAAPARVAPGPPPSLGFRLIEGKLRHRFGDLDLVLDDAGH